LERVLIVFHEMLPLLATPIGAKRKINDRRLARQQTAPAYGPAP
jgi:hypothetical protein